MGGGAKLRKKVEGKLGREKAKKFPLNGKYLRAGEKERERGLHFSSSFHENTKGELYRHSGGGNVERDPLPLSPPEGVS